MTIQMKKLHHIRPFADDVSLEQVIGGMLYDRYQGMMTDAPPQRILELLHLAGPEPEGIQDAQDKQDKLKTALAVWRDSKPSRRNERNGRRD